MRERLEELLLSAYAPYSDFKVAAIVEMNDGTTFTGVNIENLSFSATMCAERVAIFSAVNHGYRKGDFKALYLLAKRDDKVMPCFVCRQVMSEFFTGEELLYTYPNDGKVTTYQIKELIPYGFDSEVI